MTNTFEWLTPVPTEDGATWITHRSVDERYVIIEGGGYFVVLAASSSTRAGWAVNGRI